MKVRIFYLTAFIYSWAVWAAAIFIRPENVPPNTLVSLGGAGTIVALIVTLIFLYNKTDRAAYTRRLISGGRIPLWIFASLLLPFAVNIISNGFSLNISREFLAAGPLYAVFILLFGPVPEELAWRGIAFDALSERSYYKAQFIVAGLWALWHLPLFFIPGSYQAELGLFSTEFWLFFVMILPVSIITGYIYLKSRRSILMAVLFHYAVNISGEIFESSPTGRLISTAIYIVIAIALLVKPVSE